MLVRSFSPLALGELALGSLIGTFVASGCLVYDAQLLRPDTHGAVSETSLPVDAGYPSVIDSGAPPARVTAAQAGDFDAGLAAIGGDAGDGSDDRGVAGGRASAPDRCPNDPNKREPGVCGCGVAEKDTADAVSCLGLLAALRHRYTFDGSAAVVRDVVGESDAVIFGTQLQGTGSLQLSGDYRQTHVELPPSLLTEQRRATGVWDHTVELWISWDATDQQEQVFELSDINLAGETNLLGVLIGQIAEGLRAGRMFYLATQGAAQAHPHVGLVMPGMAEVSLDAARPLHRSELTHLAVVVSETEREMRLFMDGVVDAEVMLPEAALQLGDSYSWLGASPNANGRGFHGRYYELRIYGRALSEAELATSFRAGPDASFLER